LEITFAGTDATGGSRINDERRFLCRVCHGVGRFQGDGKGIVLEIDGNRPRAWSCVKKLVKTVHHQEM
jgi:hypothetical protein